jgi:hypothetical protein
MYQREPIGSLLAVSCCVLCAILTLYCSQMKCLFDFHWPDEITLLHIPELVPRSRPTVPTFPCTGRWLTVIHDIGGSHVVILLKYVQFRCRHAKLSVTTSNHHYLQPLLGEGGSVERRSHVHGATQIHKFYLDLCLISGSRNTEKRVTKYGTVMKLFSKNRGGCRIRTPLYVWVLIHHI